MVLLCLLEQVQHPFSDTLYLVQTMVAPRFHDIVENLIGAIREGQIPEGTRLPTHRALADKFNIATATATRVYAELHKRGFAVGEIGRGTFARNPRLADVVDFRHGANHQPLIDLSLNSPTEPEQESMLRQTLLALASEKDIGEFLAYQPHPGRWRDRLTAAEWLTTVHRTFGPEDILVTSGAQHALAISLITLCKPGDTIATEAFTYPGFKILAALHDVNLAALPVDEEGILPDQLEELCTHKKIAALYCTPTLHNPLGTVMPLRRRRQIVETCRKHDVQIIEDDAYGFLEPEPPPSFLALAPERAFGAKSLSKIIGPGLRIGYAIVPAPFQPRVEAAIRGTTWTVPPLTAAIATRWLQDGSVAELIRLKRLRARARQLLARRILSGFEIQGHPSSYYLWLELPRPWRTDDLLAILHKRRMAVSPGSAFATSSIASSTAVRIALGTPPEEDLVRGVRNIAEILHNKPEAYHLEA
jgi:DNA-binding transcriptional MocR family regulator